VSSPNRRGEARGFEAERPRATGTMLHPQQRAGVEPLGGNVKVKTSETNPCGEGTVISESVRDLGFTLPWREVKEQ
jgi:hypothetical protein